MRKFGLSPLVLLSLSSAIMTLPACSGPDNSARTKDLVTDVNQLNGGTYYYYVEGSLLFRGLCATGLPLFKENCQGELASVDYAQFKVRIAAEIDESIKSLSTRIKSLKAELTQATVDMESAKAELADLEPKISAESDTLAEKNAAVASDDATISQYESKIQGVDAQLAMTPDSTALISLKADLSAELAALKTQRADRAAAAALSQSNVASMTAQRATAEAKRDAAITLIASLEASTTATRAERDLAREEKDQLEATLVALETSGIGFRVLSGDDAADMKPFAARMREYFVDKATGSFGPGDLALVASSSTTDHKVQVTSSSKIDSVVVELMIALPDASNYDDYLIKLTHPDGTQVVLQTNANGSAALQTRANRKVAFGDAADVAVDGLSALKGKSAAGTWTLSVVDDDGVDSAVHKYLKLNFK